VPTLNVPDVFKPHVSRIADLSETEFEAFSKTLTGLKPHLKPDALVKSATEANSAVPDLADILQALINLSIGRHRSEIPLEEFVSGVSKSIKIDPKKIGLFEQRLQEILSINSVSMSARAFDIQHKYEKVLATVTIVSDIRSVFNTSGTEVLGAMIVHNLAVGYLEDGEFKETVFAMDDRDVSAMKKVIDRAEMKSALLERLIEKAGVDYLESK
jgi:hypothetical protein